MSTPFVSSRRLRDSNSIAFTYDHLGRLTAKDLPGSELDISYSYDLMSRMTSAATSSQTLSFTFDALGRNLTQVGPRRTVSYVYDVAGRRTQMTYADSGLYLNYDYDVAGGLTKIRENGATSGTGVLATYAYDDHGRRTSLTRGNGAVTSYTYDNVDRLTQIAEDFTGGTTYDRHVDYTLDPAGAIASSTGSSDSYAWTGHYAVNRSYTANGLNQYTAAGSITPTYDSRGNVTSAGSTTYGYSSENRLTSASGGITLSYDPIGRLYEAAGATTTRMGYDGDRMIAEYNSSDALQRRYVYGPGTDELLVWYEGTDTSTRHYYHTDERGSVIALSNNSGALTDINRYDEYGIPGSNAGRFQYTGQQWLSDLGMYYYRNRIYSPTLGRFLQTDPIGFGGGMNLHAYVFNDPVNRTDPSGLCTLMGHFISVWEHGGYGPWKLDDSWWTGSDCGFDFIGSRLMGDSPLDGNNMGDGSVDPADRQCTVGSERGHVNVSINGNNVRVTGNIQFYNGAYGNETSSLLSNPSPYLNAINSNWSGEFGRYSVATNMTSGPGGLTAYVGGGLEAASFGGPLYLPPVTGQPGDPYYSAFERIVAHEFGHGGLGLSLGPGYSHLDGGIMANNAPIAPHLESHIDKLLEQCH